MLWWSWSARETVERDMFNFLAISFIVGNLFSMNVNMKEGKKITQTFALIMQTIEYAGSKKFFTLTK